MKAYLASGWIANFGVVPWFLSFAFLLAPALDFLLFLLLRVTLVFDTMLRLLKNYQFQSNPFLLSKTRFVKNLLKVTVILTINANANNNYQDIVMAKGEQKILTIEGFQRVSLGNREVIKYKYIPKEKQLVVKGNKVGFTNLIVWENSKKQNFRFYVLSKNSFLKTVEYIQNIKAMNLEVKSLGTSLEVRGVINNLNDLRELVKLKKNKQIITSQVNISLSLKKKIIGDIYEQFIKRSIRNYKCKVESITINCFFNKNTPLNTHFKKFYNEKYTVSFMPVDLNKHGTNYKVHLKIFLVETINEENFSFGLDQLKGAILDAYDSKGSGLLSNNEIFINEQKVSLSLLAEPQVYIRPQKTMNISVGSELPFERNSNVGLYTEWKFAGLKVQITLENMGNDMVMDYSTELTKPSKSGVSGSKENANLIVPVGKTFQFFHIGYSAAGERDSSFPFLSKIPLLGKLFQSSSKQSSQKKIVGFIKVNEENG